MGAARHTRTCALRSALRYLRTHRWNWPRAWARSSAICLYALLALSLHIAGPFRAGGKDVPTKGISLRFGGFLNASTYKDFDLPEKMDQVDDCDADPLEPEEFPCEEGAGVGWSDDGGGPEAEEAARNERFQAIYKDIRDDIDHQSLHFMAPLRTRTC